MILIVKNITIKILEHCKHIYLHILYIIHYLFSDNSARKHTYVHTKCTMEHTG